MSIAPSFIVMPITDPKDSLNNTSNSLPREWKLFLSQIYLKAKSYNFSVKFDMQLVEVRFY